MTTTGNAVPELYDGLIVAVEDRITRDGKRYNKIHFYGKHPESNDLVQWTARAVYYVERYGWDQAKANAALYDPTFNIFENLENGRKKNDRP